MRNKANCKEDYSIFRCSFFNLEDGQEEEAFRLQVGNLDMAGLTYENLVRIHELLTKFLERDKEGGQNGSNLAI